MNQWIDVLSVMQHININTLHLQTKTVKNKP